MDNNILKINGEYVKFYVTTNSAMPKILKNTGAVTVLHKDDITKQVYSYTQGKVTYINNPQNEIWLANQLIASGYGVSSKEVRDILEQIGKIDSETGLSKYATDINYLNAAYSYSLQYSANLYDDITKNYVSNTGDIGDTHIDFDDGGKLPVEYLRDLTTPAEYKTATILEGLSYTYLLYQLPYVYLNEIKYNTYKSDISYEIISPKFNLPVGANITYVYRHLEICNYDSAGFTNITQEFSYTHSNQQTPTTFSNVVNINNQHNATYTYINSLTRYQTLGSTVKYQYITYEGSQILSNALLYNSGSSSYKYYPRLLEHGYKLVSYENYIYPSYESIGTIIINGYHAISYKNCIANTTGIPNYSETVRKFYSTSNNSYFNVDDTQIMLSKGSSYTVFSIPTEYEIENAYFSFNAYLKEKKQYKNKYIENCTGDIYFADDNFNATGQIYPKLIATTFSTKSKLANTDPCFVPTNIYCLNNRHELAYDTILHIKCNKVEDNSYMYVVSVDGQNYSDYYSTGEDIKQITFNDAFVQNEEYNGTRWFKAKDLPYIFMY